MQLTNSSDSHRVKLIKTLLCVISFLGLGGCNTLLGSSLLDLQIRISESFAVTSNLVPARSIGYLIGGIASGLIDRFLGPNMILFISNFIAGAAIAIAPWFKSFYFVYSFILLSGFAQGIFDIVCNTYILRIWKDSKSLSNYVQVLHGAFGVGALITPLISQPFLLPLNDDDSSDGVTITKTDNITIQGNYTPNDVKVQWAFLSITALQFISSVGFLIFHFKDKTKQQTIDTNEEDIDDQPKKWKIYVGVGLMALFANTTFGISVLVGSLAPAYVVKSDLHMSKATGASLVTVFWVVITAYKVFFVVISNFIGDKYLILFSYCSELAAIFVLIPHAGYNRLCIWIGLTFVGIGYASLFTVTLSKLQKYFILTNALASFIFINGSIGEAIHPWIASKLMDTKPVSFVYYLAMVSFLNTSICIILPIICDKIFASEKKRTYTRTSSIRSWTR
ncbi:sodium-dependent glucose transporter 1-like [Panonychus citri]|uniref:sodium-dependent glucose transporter 1-like n=1 Tax=Panonychus citri TaxID=50023 RepID=UPI00230801F6|nr:sodium-dependent glucose transporter 1-like [Panonychus citri]